MRVGHQTLHHSHGVNQQRQVGEDDVDPDRVLDEEAQVGGEKSHVIVARQSLEGFVSDVFVEAESAFGQFDEEDLLFGGEGVGVGVELEQDGVGFGSELVLFGSGRVLDGFWIGVLLQVSLIVRHFVFSSRTSPGDRFVQTDLNDGPVQARQFGYLLESVVRARDEDPVGRSSAQSRLSG